MAKYKMIAEHEQISLYDLEGSLENVRDIIQSYIDEYGKEAHLSVEVDQGYYDDCHVFYVNYEREETDKERNRRLAKAHKEREKNKAAKVKKEEKERAELVRLQKKYGED